MVRVNKERWQNPEWVKKMLTALNTKPTKPEQFLSTLLSKYFPQFEYNGNGTLGIVLGGFIPDFVNVNGKKEVIEIFGDYFHSPEVLGDRWQGSELGRIMVFNSLGYKCLVIWENELKTKKEAEIVVLIGSFFEGEKNYAKQRGVRGLKK